MFTLYLHCSPWNKKYTPVHCNTMAYQFEMVIFSFRFPICLGCDVTWHDIRFVCTFGFFFSYFYWFIIHNEWFNIFHFHFIIDKGNFFLYNLLYSVLVKLSVEGRASIHFILLGGVARID